MPEFKLNTEGAVIVLLPDMCGFKHSRMLAWADLDAFTQGYIEAMFFTWPEDEGDYIGGITSPGFADLARETLARIIADCDSFQQQEAANLSAAYGVDYDATQAGRDFWFTRGGHGVGFWDSGLGDLGDKLSHAARDYGNLDAYLGDDGHVYLG